MKKYTPEEQEELRQALEQFTAAVESVKVEIANSLEKVAKTMQNVRGFNTAYVKPPEDNKENTDGTR